jgi:hypothetical protein
MGELLKRRGNMKSTKKIRKMSLLKNEQWWEKSKKRWLRTGRWWLSLPKLQACLENMASQSDTKIDRKNKEEG